MTDRAIDLLNMSRSQAESLGDDEFERWQNLHDAKLRGDEFQASADEGLDLLVQNAKDDLTETVEIFGVDVDVRVTLNDRQYKLIKEFQEYQGKSQEDIDDIEKLKDRAIEFLAEVTDNNEAEWKDVISEIGFRGLDKILRKVLEPIKTKRESVEKFRS